MATLRAQCGAALCVHVCDPNPVAACNTAASAGLVLQLSECAHKTALVRATLRDVAALERQLGESLGMRTCGSLYVPEHPAQHASLQRQAAVLANAAGADADVAAGAAAGAARFVSSTEAEALAPWLSLRGYRDSAAADGLPPLHVLHVPGDAVLDPCVLAGAYLRAARGLCADRGSIGGGGGGDGGGGGGSCGGALELRHERRRCTALRV
eukprot:g5611.t1